MKKLLPLCLVLLATACTIPSNYVKTTNTAISLLEVIVQDIVLAQKPNDPDAILLKEAVKTTIEGIRLAVEDQKLSKEDLKILGKALEDLIDPIVVWAQANGKSAEWINNNLAAIRMAFILLKQLVE